MSKLIINGIIIVIVGIIVIKYKNFKLLSQYSRVNGIIKDRKKLSRNSGKTLIIIGVQFIVAGIGVFFFPLKEDIILTIFIRIMLVEIMVLIITNRKYIKLK